MQDAYYVWEKKTNEMVWKGNLRSREVSVDEGGRSRAAAAAAVGAEECHQEYQQTDEGEDCKRKVGLINK